MAMNRYILATCILAAAASPLHAQHAGHGDHSNHAAQGAAKPATTASLRFPDASLVASDGRKVRFSSDVLGDRLIVMDFVYTNCSTVCPVVSAIFSQLQERLGARMDKEVRLVSVTVDPARDTPAQLKTYSAKHGARSEWWWLSGHPESVTSVLKAAGTWTPNFEDHPAVVLVGDARTGQWTRFYGFASPDEILARLDALADARKAGGHQHHHH
jgi:protein SCO1/2